jgi:23S rRNA (pseudouridine1915-N3)-methyltransferase
MRIHLVWPGKTRNPHLRTLVEEYRGRVQHFARCELSEVKAATESDVRVGIDKESQRISDALSNDDLSILLDIAGTEWNSDELARQIQGWEERGTKSVAFIVGGPNGVSDDVKRRITRKWSLSRLTLTHELARVVLLEQLYRAYAIIHRLPFVK